MKDSSSDEGTGDASWLGIVDDDLKGSFSDAPAKSPQLANSFCPRERHGIKAI